MFEVLVLSEDDYNCKTELEKQNYFGWVHWLIYCLFITTIININKEKAQAARRKGVIDYTSYTHCFIFCPNILSFAGLLIFISKPEVSGCFGKS